jgi:3-methylcrotonyl-CoA carboxylase alpha subunit
MFGTILIANRGENACRIIRTARRLGVRCIAVYSDVDAGALHVQMADAAYRLGPAPARESYLAIDRVIEAARRGGAEAVHPGYGFLSENAEFAEACTAAGLVFIGPPAAAIRAMGSKAEAKARMEQAGVPLVPGYHGAAQELEVLREEAARIGYPVLVKASAGGGGKGMRAAHTPEELAEAVALAKGEAHSAFGDDRVLLERYLDRPRHIEIQVFADTHGNVVSLFERDCSIQRRHQKVLEEAPAPGMDPARRREMGEAACAAARAIGYVGAGTVEFIAADGAFYFMEMNTRLQVEHPVTEMITGQDLVEWQLRVASGERLPLSQEELAIAGHAIEARLYAEDPARDFAPSVGVLRHLRLPAAGPWLRIDGGVRAGDAIPVHYDPMIAKLIVHGADRDEAARRLGAALRDCEIVGVQTNLALLQAIAAYPSWRAGAFDTGFIARHAAELLALPKPSRAVLAAAVSYLLAEQRRHALARAAGSNDPYSPWAQANAWRLNGDGYQDFVLRTGDSALMLRAHLRGDGSFRLDLPDGAAEVSAVLDADGVLHLYMDGAAADLRVLRNGDDLAVLLGGACHLLTPVDPLAPAQIDRAGSDRVTAPMPGRIVELIAPGTSVRRGDVLVVMEAMKVQMRLPAPRDGTIAAVLCAPGDLVQDGAELLRFAEAD